MRSTLGLLPLALPVLLLGCTGVLSALEFDDAGVPLDAGPRSDGAPPPTPDAGPPRDAGAGRDSGPPLPPPSGVPELGPLPAGVVATWPAEPRTTREVVVRTAAEFVAAASMPGTRVRVAASFSQPVQISADDVDVSFEAGVGIGALQIDRALHRVRLVGGRYARIEIQVPAQFFPGPTEWRSEWMAEDVMLDSVEVDSGNNAIEIRGRRIAVIRSRVHARDYSLWCAETDRFQTEDVIVAGNTFVSDGPEATFRMVDVLRSITVDNRLENGNKHNYRVHGVSDLNFSARNLLVRTGVMLGTLPGDDLGRQWVIDSTLHHAVPSLFEADPMIDALVSTNNVIYSDHSSCWLCGSPPASWTVEGNRVEPYRSAPP